MRPPEGEGFRKTEYSRVFCMDLSELCHDLDVKQYKAESRSQKHKEARRERKIPPGLARGQIICRRMSPSFSRAQRAEAPPQRAS